MAVQWQNNYVTFDKLETEFIASTTINKMNDTNLPNIKHTCLSLVYYSLKKHTYTHMHTRASPLLLMRASLHKPFTE